jgi:hypothetical protein
MPSGHLAGRIKNSAEGATLLEPNKPEFLLIDNFYQRVRSAVGPFAIHPYFSNKEQFL